MQPADYTVSGTLSWAAGDNTTKTLTLTAVDNSVYSVNKTVILTLSAPTGGAMLESPSATTVTIVNDDTVITENRWGFRALISTGTADESVSVTVPTDSLIIVTAQANVSSSGSNIGTRQYLVFAGTQESTPIDIPFDTSVPGRIATGSFELAAGTYDIGARIRVSGGARMSWADVLLRIEVIQQ